MRRDSWKFRYTGSDLSEAATARLAFHQERIQWWKQQRGEVMQRIRAEGLEIDESLAVGYRSPKSRDWEDATRVNIRRDLREQLNECSHKLAQHTELAISYSAWRRVLQANPEASLKLDHADWQFFFSSADDAMAAGD